MGGCILRLFQGIHPLLSLITSERWAFRALKMRLVRQVLLLARYASENASRTPGSCPQSVESAVLRAFEDASRTVEAYFLHRMLPKMRRVPQEAFLSTARIFRTVGGRFWYRVLSHICYRFFPMSYYSMFYIPPCILSFASILYYATKASKGNVAISEFRFGMVLVGWLTKYVLMAFYSFL